MSGGRFEYSQFRIRDIADEIDEIIANEGREFSDETLKEFRTASALLKVAHVYTHRIDWLVSGDDGEDSFHERLAEDLKDVSSSAKKVGII